MTTYTILAAVLPGSAADPPHASLAAQVPSRAAFARLLIKQGTAAGTEREVIEHLKLWGGEAPDSPDMEPGVLYVQHTHLVIERRRYGTEHRK